MFKKVKRFFGRLFYTDQQLKEVKTLIKEAIKILEKDESQIKRLERWVGHLDDQIEELNEINARQTQEIEDLENKITKYKKRIKDCEYHLNIFE